MLGEANFSDHGANRLGASALMQGLADGYFVIPYTIGHYLASTPLPKVTTDHDAFKEAADRRADADQPAAGRQRAQVASARSTASWARIIWDDVGMARTDASLKRALEAIPELRDDFWHNVSVPGTPDNLNQSLEYAGRVADYLEFAELLALDALHRTRIVRRTFPRGKPDARRRSAARRRTLLLRRRVGVQGRRSATRAAQGAARVRRGSSHAAELQIVWGCEETSSLSR